MQYKSKSCKPIKTPEDPKHWGGSYTSIEGIYYVLWSLFSHYPNETNVTLQGSGDECGSVELVKTRELNVTVSEGQNLALGSCRQGFIVLWLNYWIPANLKQSMHKTLALGILSSLLACDANACLMVPSLIRIFTFIFIFGFLINACIPDDRQACFYADFIYFCQEI